MENKKINFQAGAENLSNDAEYQQALAKFNAENFSPEQVAKYKKRKQIAIAMIVLGVFIFFINPSVSMVLIFLSLIFFVKPKFDELAFRKEKFAKENGLAILPDDYSIFLNSAFDRMNSRYTNFHRFNRFRKKQHRIWLLSLRNWRKKFGSFLYFLCRRNFAVRGAKFGD